MLFGLEQSRLLARLVRARCSLCTSREWWLGAVHYVPREESLGWQWKCVCATKTFLPLQRRHSEHIECLNVSKLRSFDSQSKGAQGISIERSMYSSPKVLLTLWIIIWNTVSCHVNCTEANFWQTKKCRQQRLLNLRDFPRWKKIQGPTVACCVQVRRWNQPSLSKARAPRLGHWSSLKPPYSIFLLFLTSPENLCEISTRLRFILTIFTGFASVVHFQLVYMASVINFDHESSIAVWNPMDAQGGSWS